KFRGRTVELNLELLNGVDDWKERNLTRFGLQDRDAVKEIFVCSWTASVYSWEERGRRQSDARRERNQGNKSAAVERKRDNFLVADHLAEASGLGSEQRRIGGHGHALIDPTRGQIDVKPHPPATCELQNPPNKTRATP